MPHFVIVDRDQANKILSVHSDMGNACEDQMIRSEMNPTTEFEVINVHSDIIPRDMDCPLTRRNTKTIGNLTWLLRNLAIRNKNHPEFNSVFKKLRMEFAGRNRKSNV